MALYKSIIIIIILLALHETGMVPLLSCEIDMTE